MNKNKNIFSLDSYVRAINEVTKIGKKPIGVIINGKLKTSIQEYFNQGETRNIKENAPAQGKEFDPIFGGDLIICGLPVYFDVELKKDFEVFYNKKIFEKVVWSNYIRDSLRSGVTIEDLQNYD